MRVTAQSKVKAMAMAANPINWGRRAHIGATLGVASMAQSTAAFAQATNLAGVTETANENLRPIGLTVTIVAALIGVILVVLGLVKIATRKPGSQDSLGGNITMIIIGSLLMVIAAIIGIMTQSTVGGGATGLDQLDGLG